MNKTKFLFETSWEVCNKVGGIYTVLMTKAPTMNEKFNGSYILVGPDLVKNNNDNSDFIQDDNLFRSWREYCLRQGLNIRIGYWNIKSKPTVILVNFTQYFSEKNKIFASYWEKFGVDSLTGGWDYIEPFLFGYASARVIENYYNFYIDAEDEVVAQFHEWMTGSGVMYLKTHVPQIATSFTTHATVLGRCLAGNGVPLYSQMQNFTPDVVARDFNVVSKHSLEKLSALNADSFSTVSEITGNECRQFFGKEVAKITPNGFDESLVPEESEFKRKRSIARTKVFDIVEKLSGYRPSDDSFLIINSGRYEFKNKGIDVFIRSMQRLNENKSIKRKIIAVIAVPAAHIGVNVEGFLTHSLNNPDLDPILSSIKSSGISNSKEGNVNIVFIPSYLDGKDGAVNIPYFDFLTGFDISIFPSYYEPWGYTPMESMAFSVPSITTTLAGFGLWVKDNISNPNNALTIIERTDDNEKECIEKIADRVEEIMSMDENMIKTLREDCKYIFSKVQWKELADYYMQSYNIALQQSKTRIEQYIHKKPLNITSDIQTFWGNNPIWKKFLVKTSLPDELKPLQRLSRNLWWSWNYDAYNLFCMIDKERFLSYDRNPIKLLDSLTSEECDRLLNDKDFMSSLNDVVNHFDTYINERKQKNNDLIAYFSMEFGIHDSLQIFSGGLGMLAGDYLKQASDSNKNIVGIGLMYRHGYFVQHITMEGEQQSKEAVQSFSALPIKAVRDESGSWIKVSIQFPSRTVKAKIWRCDVGVTPLYLLDTDIDENTPEDRDITQQLYGGDNEMRLKQELLLGIGGIRMLKALGIDAKIYHLNEGHSAFSSLERINNYINEEKMSYFQALEKVRCSTLFTTHTPVPAGHDMFEEELMRKYFVGLANRLTLSWNDFMLLGRKSNENRNEKFSVSVLCINCAENINGVSRIHGRVTREMFKYLYDGYFADELNIGYVTNGVHLNTWVAKQWQDLYNKYFDSKYVNDESNADYWQKIYSVPDDTIWDTHKELKSELIDFVKHRLEKELRDRGESPELYVHTASVLDKDKLTIGFARRFATYKRANLLFTNLERLESIVNKGVQFIFAGKAHPADKMGQELIKNIIRISKMPQFVGKVVFIENYDMYVAKHLIRGVDIWLNTPTRPLEASGTSGEKAIMNGGVNFSVLDGWWAEGYKKGAGWALDEKPAYSDNNLQNILDAEMIYSILENEIIPTYYSNDENNIPLGWVKQIKNTIAMIAPHFTMKRQLDDYFSKYYNRMFVRQNLMSENNNAKAREIALFKQRMKSLWNTIELITVQTPNSETKGFCLGEKFEARIVLNTGKIPSENIGIEMLITHKENERIDHVEKVCQFVLVSSKSGIAEYKVSMPFITSGVKDYAFRVYPKHPLLSSRMDLPLVKWI